MKRVYEKATKTLLRFMALGSLVAFLYIELGDEEVYRDLPNFILNVTTLCLVILLMMRMEAYSEKAGSAAAEIQRMTKWLERTYGIAAEDTQNRPWNRPSGEQNLG